MSTSPDKAAQVARIEALEAGNADADTLAAAWRGAKGYQLNLRGRLRRAVARSPSLPPALAPEVLAAQPVELFENPALPLLLLECTDLLTRAPRRFWDHCLRARSLPASLMPALVAAAPPWRLSELTRRPEFDAGDAPALLERLFQTLSPPEIPRWGLTDAQALQLCQGWYEPTLTVDAALLAALRARPDDLCARVLLARCEQISLDEALGLWVRHAATNHLVETSLAARRDLPRDLLDKLAKGGAGPLRVAAAANPAAAPETLAWLIKDHNTDASAAALLNPSLPRAHYAVLLTRGTARRRAVLASRPDLLPDDYALLAQSGEIEVRAAVADNPHAPAAVIARLAEDLREEVREIARAHPAFGPDEPPPPPPPSPPPRKKPAASDTAALLERARVALVGDTSGGARWEPALTWALHDGPKPPRVPLSAQDRKKLVRTGLKLVGDDPRLFDPVQTRLFAALVDALGGLPQLNSAAHVAAAKSGAAAIDALAVRWMARLTVAGYAEPEALALLCDDRLALRNARGVTSLQRAIAFSALRERADRAVELLRALRAAKPRARFAEDLARMIPELDLPAERTRALLVALYADPKARAEMDFHVLNNFARVGGMALVDDLGAHAPSLAREFLRGLKPDYGWQVPTDVAAAAKAAR